jgi:hypothetical protein
MGLLPRPANWIGRLIDKRVEQLDELILNESIYELDLKLDSCSDSISKLDRIWMNFDRPVEQLNHGSSTGPFENSLIWKPFNLWALSLVQLPLSLSLSHV